MNQWDYKVVTLRTLHRPDAVEWCIGSESGNETVQKMLDAMGREGWELITFLPARPVDELWKHPVSGQESIIPADPWLYHAVFKRPPETLEEQQKRIDHERMERRIKKHSAP